MPKYRYIQQKKKRKPISLPRKALWLAKKALQENWKEHKYIDTTGDAISSSTTGTVTLLNGLNLGDTATTRTGQKIKMTSVLARVQGYILTAQTKVNIRIMLLIDYQTNGSSVPTLATIVKDTGSEISPLLIGNGKRFKVLANGWITLDSNNIRMNEWTKYIKLNEVVEYSTGDAGSIADIRTGALLLVQYSDIPAASNPPLLYYYIRVRFVDT